MRFLHSMRFLLQMAHNNAFYAVGLAHERLQKNARQVFYAFFSVTYHKLLHWFYFLLYACTTRLHETDGMDFRFYTTIKPQNFWNSQEIDCLALYCIALKIEWVREREKQRKESCLRNTWSSATSAFISPGTQSLVLTIKHRNIGHFATMLKWINTV